MVNILGNGEGDTLSGLENLLANPDVSLHLYGKRQSAKGRKMGHFTVLAGTPDEAEKRAHALRSLLHWTR
jgi:phosphoribosylaminoimidazole carboxylase (NCAIR synthetase)